MFNQYYRLPELVEVNHSKLFILSLAEDASDYVLMQAMRAPLLELVLAKEGESCELVVRLQAGFNLSAATAEVDSYKPCPITVFEHEVFERVVVKPELALFRTLGQGARLYASGGQKPSKLIDKLRKGLRILLVPRSALCPSNGKSKGLNQSKSIMMHLKCDGGFELVALEADLRLSEDPAMLQNAKSVLAREPEYDASAASLALLITELEQARRELHEYLSGSERHQGLVSEVLKLEPMLVQRRQWLLRQYAQRQERVQLGNSANDHLSDTEQLQRLIKCYELLCPPNVNAMVQSITGEN